MFWALLYDLVDDYFERRAPLRADHLALAQAAHERGELVMAGALDEPPDMAILVFRAGGPEVIETFVANDPYVQQGLISSWQIRRWNVVIGAGGP
jgi:uncharacterized protein YciI